MNMQSFQGIRETEFSVLSQHLPNDQLETLRTLVTMLLREVDVLENSTPISGSASKAVNRKHEENFCLQELVQRYEADLIRRALIQAQGRQRKAARLLGVKVSTLNAKIKRYEINWRVVGTEYEHTT